MRPNRGPAQPQYWDKEQYQRASERQRQEYMQGLSPAEREHAHQVSNDDHPSGGSVPQNLNFYPQQPNYVQQAQRAQIDVADDDFEDDDFGDVDEHTHPSEPTKMHPSDKRHQNSSLNINAGRAEMNGVSPHTDNHFRQNSSRLDNQQWVQPVTEMTHKRGNMMSHNQYTGPKFSNPGSQGPSRLGYEHAGKEKQFIPSSHQYGASLSKLPESSLGAKSSARLKPMSTGTEIPVESHEQVHADDFDEPQQENSNEFDYEPSQQYEAQQDDVEGTKNFDKAYDKLIKKYYNAEGGNLLIPQDDMVMHQYNMQNKVQFDADEQQRKIREMARRKEEKIRQAQIEKEVKEMEECSFAPKINRMKKKAGQSIMVDKLEGSAEPTETYEEEEGEDVRDINQFVADQNRFLQMKRAREEELKHRRMEEEMKLKEKATKMNKRSLQILQQREARLEKERKLKEVLNRKRSLEPPSREDNLGKTQTMPTTSRLKQPTSLTRHTRSGSKRADREAQAEQLFKPKINKNTQKLVENRNKRLDQNMDAQKKSKPLPTQTTQASHKTRGSVKQIGQQVQPPPSPAPLVKASDKYLLQKFNKEFDQVRDEVVDLSATDFKDSPNKSPEREEMQQFSPTSYRERHASKQEEKPQLSILLGAPLNYLKYKEFLVGLGLLTEQSSLHSSSPERALLFDLWKILTGEESDTIYVENLRVMVQVILRLIDPARVVPVPADEQRETDGQRAEYNASILDHSQVGVVNAKNQFCVKNTEVQRVQAKFKVFYLNRLQFQGRQLEQKKDQKAQEIIGKMSFKPKIEKSSELMAQQRKRKVAQQLGIDIEKLDDMQIDPIELLRAQGDMMAIAREKKAQEAIEEKVAKCTFAPDTKKKKIVRVDPEELERCSVGSINLDGIAKKKQTGIRKDTDVAGAGCNNFIGGLFEHKKPSPVPKNSIGKPASKSTGKVLAPAHPDGDRAKYERLYSLRKKQIDKTDKSKEDYEFEKNAAECTFAPKLSTKQPKYLREKIKQQEVVPPLRQPATAPTANSQQAAQSARDRQERFEQKQLERMRKAREEKERKNAMMSRGIPKAKPLSAAQMAEQEAVKQMLLEKKGLVKSQMMTQYVLQGISPPNKMAHHERSQAQQMDSDDDTPEVSKFKARGQALEYPDTEEHLNIETSEEGAHLGMLPPTYLNEHLEEEGGPMSLTIVTKEHELQQEAAAVTLEDQQATQEEELKEELHHMTAEVPPAQILDEDLDFEEQEKLSKQLSRHNHQSAPVESQEEAQMRASHSATDTANIKDASEAKVDQHQHLTNKLPTLQEEQVEEIVEPFQQEVYQPEQAMPEQAPEVESDTMKQPTDLADHLEENEEADLGEDSGTQPLLFVDINLGGDEQERIVVYEGDTAEQLALAFCQEHDLDEETQEKLTELLKQQMAGVLPKIDEDEDYDDEEGSKAA